MVKVKLLEGRTYCANEVNMSTNKMFATYLWKKKGDVLEIPERYMRHWDIQGGLRRGILTIVKEEPVAEAKATKKEKVKAVA